MSTTMIRRALPLALLLGCSSTQGTPPAQNDVSVETPTAEPAPTTPETPEPMPEPQPVSDADLSAVGKSINAFSADIYGQVKGEPGNLVLSPASIAIALGMTYQGATGTTADEFSSVLHIQDSGLDAAQWHAAAGELGVRWTSSGDAEGRVPPPEIALANRLFGAKGLPFKEDFLSDSLRDYRAPMERLDFSATEPARAHINGWVEDRTRDRIKDLLPPGSIQSDTLLVLANAIYFKAQWLDPFNEAATKDAPFFAGGSKEVKVPTMRTVKNFRYTSADDATFVEMPYGGGSYAMMLAVPNERDGLSALESKLSADAFFGWTSKMKFQRVELAMPKFRVEPPKSLELTPTLEALGLKKAFTDGAEFFGMVDPKDDLLKITNVFHKGFIEVDETGTEAAAATAVVMGRAGSMPSEPVKVDVDRPFLFFIRDTQTGTVLFMGRVVDPRS